MASSFPIGKNPQAIPNIPPSVWQMIPIRESGEPLVRLENDEHFLLDPQYVQIGIPGAISDMYLRRSFVERLRAMIRLFPRGYKIKIWDAWRPLSVQRALYEKDRKYVRNMWKRASRRFTEKDVQQEVERYVAPPSNDPKKPPHHLTGGALDFTIVSAMGRALDFGTDFDEFSERAAWQYPIASTLRRILYTRMWQVGLVPMFSEWWHVNAPETQYGCAVLGKNVATFGPIAPSFFGKTIGIAGR